MGLLLDNGRVLRDRIGDAIFSRVAGPDGPENRARIHDAPGPRWFGPERPVRQVHADASMFTGGLSALLLQSLHPLAMAAVAGHSGFRGDPWGRLQRTSTFLAMTTYGPADSAQRAVDRVRAVHETVHGTTPDGQEYSAADPHLLCWVHIAEVDSFLRAHQRFGARPLDAAGCDAYVEDMARIATALGVPDPPTNRAELTDRLAAYRSELRATPEARSTARFLLLNPPVPVLARLPYGALAAGAVSLLPVWASRALWLPRVPPAEDVFVRPLGTAVTAVIRWALAPGERARRGQEDRLPGPGQGTAG
ncbi:oxygenase MpaB family protein [Streptomyces sp. NPDC057433]|uniref:oxygenase MpaB family protein n=1 Tax=Streptomyces sp. NPDC057433 TaxID=3346132 RepID=UPI0036C26912